MDTQQAIDELEALKANETSDISGKTSRVNALDIAINQLKGILITQATNLETTYLSQLATKDERISQVEAEIVTKNTIIQEKVDEIIAKDNLIKEKDDEITRLRPFEPAPLPTEELLIP